VGTGGDPWDRVLELIGHVYDAALDEKLWPGLAPQIAATFDSPSTALFTLSGSSASYLSCTANQTEAMRREYVEYYHRTDVWVAGGARHGLGEVVVGQQILPDRELEETEFYRDYVRRTEVFHLIGSVIPVSPDMPAVLGIHRPRAGIAYDRHDQALVARFLPHLQRALQIRQRLAEPDIAKGLAFDVLDRSATAALVVDRDARILYANREAERLLRSGGDLAAIGGRLALRRCAPADRLMALIRGVLYSTFRSVAGLRRQFLFGLIQPISCHFFSYSH
jgi:PAS domain-containing protein